ncbi:MAG: ATP-binding protein [Bacteroidia bacterium]|nr:ATP-binding protein [Bacteroidia bacterium]
MALITRSIENKIIQKLKPNKVVIIVGARRVGKTELVKQVLKQIKEKPLILNGDDVDTINALNIKSTANYKRLLGNIKLLVIDEAQEVPDIGSKLKLMVDTIPRLKIIATGSSVFDLNNKMGEPLVGRKTTFNLFPLAQTELSKTETYLQTKSRLEDRLIFGSYPELEHLDNNQERIEYLKEQVNSYLLKDILAYEGIQKREKIVALLQIVAFRVGSELSLEGIGNELQISKNTVEKYLDLFSKVFITTKLTGFSRNLDNEITKKNKWYFMDNGIRNAVINNFNLLNQRDDKGILWENYINSERIKYLNYQSIHYNEFFWRTHNKQELDRIEEINGKLFGFEFKWNPNAKSKVPPTFEKAYPKAKVQFINPDNYLDFIT